MPFEKVRFSLIRDDMRVVELGVYMQGEVVWGRSSGFPAWPGIVLEADEWECLPEAGPGQLVLFWLKWATIGGDVFGVVEEAECQGLMEGWLKLAPLMAGRRRSRGRKSSKHPKPTLKALNCLRACAKIINHSHKKTILDEKAESLDSWRRELELNERLLCTKKPVLAYADWAIYVDDSIPMTTGDAIVDGEPVGYVGDKKGSTKPRGRPTKDPKPGPTPPKSPPARKAKAAGISTPRKRREAEPPPDTVSPPPLTQRSRCDDKNGTAKSRRRPSESPEPSPTFPKPQQAPKSNVARISKTRKRRQAQPTPHHTDSAPPVAKRPRRDNKTRTSSSTPRPPIKAPSSPSPLPAKPPSWSSSPPMTAASDVGKLKMERGVKAKRQVEEPEKENHGAAAARLLPDQPSSFEAAIGPGQPTPAALREQRISKILVQSPAAPMEADWPDIPNGPTHDSPPLPPHDKPGQSDQKLPFQPLSDRKRSNSIPQTASNSEWTAGLGKRTASEGDLYLEDGVYWIELEEGEDW